MTKFTSENAKRALEFGMLICGKSEEVLKKFEDNSIDLIYGDPPFCSKKEKNIVWEIDKVEEEFIAFEDLCEGGIERYLDRTLPIIRECYRVLKKTGSMYIHVDYRVAHYLKVEMDKIFGEGDVEKGRKLFMNNIIWHYGLGASNSKKTFLRKHDDILFYTKSEKYTFNRQRGEVTPQMKQKYCHEDEDGKYMMTYGKKHYLKGGKMYDDVWDIPTISPTSKERLGYPTQKPQALLERIISSSSNNGDIVLDPFSGGGTTPYMAQFLFRVPIGIDVSPPAIEEARIRTHGTIESLGIDTEDLKGFIVEFEEYEEMLDRFREMPWFNFQSWAVRKVGCYEFVPRNSGGPLDGYNNKTKTGVEVKRWKEKSAVGVDVYHKFYSGLEHAGYTKGFIVAFSFSKNIVDLAFEDKSNKKPIEIELVTTKELFKIISTEDLKSTLKEQEKKKFVQKPLKNIFKFKDGKTRF